MKNQGTLVAAPVRPFASTDNYPVAFQAEIKGGWHSVNSINERDAIPADRRVVGMICSVAGDQDYKLTGGLANENWQPFFATKTEHNALKDRVTTLESLIGGGEGGIDLTAITDRILVLEEGFEGISEEISVTPGPFKILRTDIDGMLPHEAIRGYTQDIVLTEGVYTQNINSNASKVSVTGVAIFSTFDATTDTLILPLPKYVGQELELLLNVSARYGDEFSPSLTVKNNDNSLAIYHPIDFENAASWTASYFLKSNLQNRWELVTPYVTQPERDTWNNKASKAVATPATDGLMSAPDKAKLNGIAEGANNYVHPATHAPSVIAQDANNRLVNDLQIADWNAKASTALATSALPGLMSAGEKIYVSNLKGVNGISYTYNGLTSGSQGTINPYYQRLILNGTGVNVKMIAGAHGQTLKLEINISNSSTTGYSIFQADGVTSIATAGGNSSYTVALYLMFVYDKWVVL